jgi:hypothetical protein
LFRFCFFPQNFMFILLLNISQSWL